MPSYLDSVASSVVCVLSRLSKLALLGVHSPPSQSRILPLKDGAARTAQKKQREGDIVFLR